jgi:phage portal protein BeeE
MGGYDYSRSCEHLIFSASSPDAVPFTQDESDWITYYTAEMIKLVERLARTSKPQIPHDRESMQNSAAASEALFLTDGLRKARETAFADWSRMSPRRFCQKNGNPTSEL